MGAFDAFADLSLHGGFLLKRVRSADESMSDALDRPALARTTITGMVLEIEMDARLSAEETSVTLYHEVLEAASVAAPRPPMAVCELNEAGFESAARQMHANLGVATPTTLNRMLALFGF